jgi:hypothetical protein
MAWAKAGRGARATPTVAAPNRKIRRLGNSAHSCGRSAAGV